MGADSHATVVLRSLQLSTLLVVLLGCIGPLYITLTDPRPVSIWWLETSIFLQHAKTENENDDVQQKRRRKSRRREELLQKLRTSDWALLQRARASLFADLSLGAFCEREAAGAIYRPMVDVSSAPLQALTPWVLDASLSENGVSVSVLLGDRAACSFDYAAWQRFNSSASQVLLVPVGSDIKYHDSALVGSTLLCRFYDHRNSPLVHVESHKIMPLSLRSFSGPGSLLVRCPIPPELRSRGRRLSLRLQRLASAGDVGNSYDLGGDGDKARHQSLLPMTRIFPLCPLPGMRSPNGNSKPSNTGSSLQPSVVSTGANLLEQPSLLSRRVQASAAVVQALNSNEHYAYNVSMCVLTGHDVSASESNRTTNRRAELLEFIEHHRLMGVEHFFFIDSHLEQDSFSSSVPKMGIHRRSHADDDDDSAPITTADILAPYVELGLVSHINWQGHACATGFTCDHDVEVATGEDEKVRVQPPRRRRVDTALSICYSRFRSSSRYMAGLRDDELLAVDASRRLEGQRVRDLRSVIEISEGSHVALAAIEMERHTYVACDQVDSSAASEKIGSRERKRKEQEAGPSTISSIVGFVPATISDPDQQDETGPSNSTLNLQGDEESGSLSPRLSFPLLTLGEYVARALQNAKGESTGGTAFRQSKALLVRTSRVVAVDFDAGELLLVEGGGDRHGAGIGLGARVMASLVGWLGRGGKEGRRRLLSTPNNQTTTGPNRGPVISLREAGHIPSRVAATRSESRTANANEYTVATIDAAVTRVLVFFRDELGSATVGGELQCRRELQLLDGASGKVAVARRPKERERGGGEGRPVSSNNTSSVSLCSVARLEKGGFSLTPPLIDVLGDRVSRALDGFIPQGEGEGEGGGGAGL